MFWKKIYLLISIFAIFALVFVACAPKEAPMEEEAMEEEVMEEEAVEEEAMEAEEEEEVMEEEAMEVITLVFSDWHLTEPGI
jgi:hypothetical protein